MAKAVGHHPAAAVRDPAAARDLLLRSRRRPRPKMQPPEPVINDPDIPVDAPVDDVCEPDIEGPDVVD